jgi:hypothetical protein
LSGVTLRTALRSAPAKKVFFAEVRITPVIDSRSASRRSSVSAIEVTYLSFIVFADLPGSSKVSVMMPSASRSQRIIATPYTRSMMVAMPMPPPTHNVARP